MQLDKLVEMIMDVNSETQFPIAIKNTVEGAGKIYYHYRSRRVFNAINDVTVHIFHKTDNTIKPSTTPIQDAEAVVRLYLFGFCV